MNARKGRLNNSYLCHVGGDQNNANLRPIIPVQRLCSQVTANLSHSQINVLASGDGEFHRPSCFSRHVAPLVHIFLRLLVLHGLVSVTRGWTCHVSWQFAVVFHDY